MKFLTYLLIGTILSSATWFFVCGKGFKEQDKEDRRAGCIASLILGLIGGLLFTLSELV
jgi:hypothetical protein